MAKSLKPASGPAGSAVDWTCGVLYVKLVLTAVFWGGTFVAGRIVAEQMGPFSAAFLRFVVATGFLILFLSRSAMPIPRVGLRLFVSLTFLALTGVFAYNALFFSGLKTVTAGRASLIIATNPAFIALFSWVFFRERLHRFKILGIVLSITGAFVVLSHGDFSAILREGLGRGELLIFGCVLSWVSYSLAGKTVMKHLPPLATVTCACFLGAILLFPPAFAEGLVDKLPTFSALAWLSLFYLGFFGSALGFIWYYEGIRTLGPSRAGVFINIVPISAIILAALLLQESVDIFLGIGAAITVTGVTLTNVQPTLQRRSGFSRESDLAESCSSRR